MSDFTDKHTFCSSTANQYTIIPVLLKLFGFSFHVVLLYQCSTAILELRNSLFLVYLGMSVCLQSHFIVWVFGFFSPFGKRICTRSTKKQSGQTGPVHQPHLLHRPLGDSPHLLAPLCINIFWLFVFIKHISVTLQLGNALRHGVRFFGDSCTGPQVGFKHSDGSLPDQHILWFCDLSSFSVNVVKSVWLDFQKARPNTNVL